jgi:RNA recognition motif-containing protein
VLGGGEGVPCRIVWGETNTLYNCVHVRFEYSELEGEQYVDVTEEEIMTQFSVFGNIVRVTLPRMVDGYMKGYAFVDFSSDEEGQEAAANAINSLHQKTFKSNLKLICHFGKKQQAPRTPVRPRNSRDIMEGSEYQQNYYPYSPVYIPHSHWNPYYGYPAAFPGMNYDSYNPIYYAQPHVSYNAQPQSNVIENNTIKAEAPSTEERPVAQEQQ